MMSESLVEIKQNSLVIKWDFPIVNFDWFCNEMNWNKQTQSRSYRSLFSSSLLPTAPSAKSHIQNFNHELNTVTMKTMALFDIEPKLSTKDPIDSLNPQPFLKEPACKTAASTWIRPYC